MKPWIYFSMIAAIFIAISDYISFDLFKRIDYIDYIIHANIVAFLGTLLFIIFSPIDIGSASLVLLLSVVVSVA